MQPVCHSAAGCIFFELSPGSTGLLVASGKGDGVASGVHRAGTGGRGSRFSAIRGFHRHNGILTKEQNAMKTSFERATSALISRVCRVGMVSVWISLVCVASVHPQNTSPLPHLRNREQQLS